MARTCPNCGADGVQVYRCKECDLEYCETCVVDDKCPDCASADRTDPGRAWWKFPQE